MPLERCFMKRLEGFEEDSASFMKRRHGVRSVEHASGGVRAVGTPGLYKTSEMRARKPVRIRWVSPQTCSSPTA